MSAPTYDIRTYGCQMNVHDSERLAGLLEEAGYIRAASDQGDEVDLVVFNTCAVRENADNRLYGNLGRLFPAKQRRPGMQIAVGGCLAQKDRATIIDRAPWVDVVFGTHNLASLPVLLERARHNEQAQVEIVEALQNFPSDLPTRRESAFSAWVSVSVGCDNTCTFCIVPSLRGTETDRRPGDVLAEIRALVETGVVEITLLGQNVNSYGRSFGDELAFGKLLRACGEIEGLDRVRFTSPHPRDFTDDVIEAMAETPNVCPQLHMPMQSGSDAVLRAMRRSYRQRRYLEIIDSVRARMPDAAITTDIIVGFPGETDADFEQTLDAVRAARFASAFTFQYSIRPGTPAATMDGHLPKPVVQERYERLIALQDAISWDVNKALVGSEVEVLVSQTQGRKDGAKGRVSGRARDGRLVHVDVHGADARPGDVVRSAVTYAAPYHVVADGSLVEHVRWRGATEPADRPNRPLTPGRPPTSLTLLTSRPV
ncbi:MAG TPA: tRNA (N6-isopentenyl adenosine(37)-C2)-methylthiotransferase MiaB [Jatrophihabitantaceae bacterium]|nr:tRNA (N6-isopentenyl adenosine(37)-C2)-methylthiotransferase MiaB [Jatrophihabitantaceae bacterium]